MYLYKFNGISYIHPYYLMLSYVPTYNTNKINNLVIINTLVPIWFEIKFGIWCLILFIIYIYFYQLLPKH